MRIELLALAASSALSARPAAAADVEARTTLLLSGRPEVRDGEAHTIVPVYQWISLVGRHMRALWFEDVALVVSAWGRAGAGEPRDGERIDADVDLAYAEGVLFEGAVALRAGRQLVTGGVSRLAQLDGASLTLGARGPLGLSGYVGAPTTPRFSEDSGDLLAGGRVFWRRSVETEIGASFVHGADEGLVSRQDAGLDARWALHPAVTLSAYGAFSLVEQRAAEIDLSASWRVLRGLEITSGYELTAPDLFLPRSSVLSVFAEESRHQLGGTVTFAPTSRIDLDGDYHAIMAETGVGHDLGIRGTIRTALGAALGIELRRLALAESGFAEARAYVQQQIGSMVVAIVDLDLFLLDVPIHDERRSMTASATVGYEVGEGWRAVATAIADTTPFVERRFEGMLKLVYAFDAGGGAAP